MQDPAEIYQTWLDVVTKAVVENDDATLLAWFGRPFLMRTADAEVLIETDEDLLSDFEVLRWGLKTQGVTNYIRLVQKARYLSEDYIEGWHVSHMLRGAVSVVPAYCNRVVLHRDGDIWRCTEADHQLSNGRFPIDLPRVNLHAFNETWAGPLSDIRAAHARAEPIYQAFLDELDRANNLRNFDYWNTLYCYPHNVHYDTVDHVVGAPEDVRPFFEQVNALLDEHKGGRIRRRTKYAEFIGSQQIVGYHDAVVTRGDDTLFGPVHSRMILVSDCDAWKSKSVTNTLKNKGFPGSQFETSDELRTLREINERMRK